MLKTYEALYIVNPTLEDGDIQAIAAETEALVSKHGGVIVRSENWGKRKLAYLVKKFTDGNFILLRFQAEADFPARLETYFKLNENIIRYLLTHYDERTLRLEEEQIKRREEELRNAPNGRGEDGRGYDDDDDDDDDDRPRRRHAGSRFGKGRNDHGDGDSDPDDDDD